MIQNIIYPTRIWSFYQLNVVSKILNLLFKTPLLINAPNQVSKFHFRRFPAGIENEFTFCIFQDYPIIHHPANLHLSLFLSLELIAIITIFWKLDC